MSWPGAKIGGAATGAAIGDGDGNAATGTDAGALAAASLGRIAAVPAPAASDEVSGLIRATSP